MQRVINPENAMIRSTVFVSLCCATLGACAADSTTKPGNDALAGENGDGEVAKADGVDTFGFMAVTKDPSLTCHLPSPCATYTLTRPNRSTVMCNDGQYHDSCAVAAVSWTAAGLSQSQSDALDAAVSGDASLGAQVLVRGQFKIYVDFLAFEPSEVWQAQLGTSDDGGTYVEVYGNNRRCVTAPCADVTEAKLNSTRTADTEGLDFDNTISAATEQQVEDAISSGGAIVRGERVYKSAVSFTNELRTVNQVFLPVTAN
jgi:hypothetical protein